MRKNNNDLKQNRKKGASTAQMSKPPPATSKKKISLSEEIAFGNSSYQDEALISLLQEYFIKHDFMDTLDTFQKDCSKGFKPTMKIQLQIKEEIITAFDAGQRQNFLVKFGQYVPMSMRVKDLRTMKLQFYLQVYFFVYSIHPQLGKKKTIDQQAKQIFITYLQHRGSTLSKESEFFQYCALAHLQKPQEHPNFKGVFTKDWIGELRQRLIEFIDKLYPTNRKPVLVTMYDRFIERSLEAEKQSQQVSEQEYQQEPIEEEIQSQHRHSENQQTKKLELELLQKKTRQLEDDKTQLINLIEASNNKYQSLQNGYKDFVEIARQNLMQSQVKWFQITQEFFAIANDLLDSCKKLQEGIPLQDPDIISRTTKKLSKYQSFINMNVEDLLSDNVDFSLFERTEHDISTDLVRRTTQYRVAPMMQLNFNKINATLSSEGEVQQKCLLLQALRWRLSRTRGVVQKRQVVMSYILYDLLGLKNNEKHVFHNLLRNSDLTVSILTAKLLNSFVKDYYAREYVVCETWMDECITTVKDAETDQRIRTILIITLQQVSLRAKAQKIMIDSDMIKWLVEKMKTERETMDVHLMEYLSTLLLNLLLRKQGLQKSEEIKEQILMTLINLMEYELMEVRSYAHGALYPLLSRKSFRDKAKQYGLEEHIKSLISNNPPPQFLNQLRYLQERLQMEEDAKEEEDDEDGDNDIDEIVDQEIDDQYNDQNNFTGSLQGEDLLMKKYPLTGPESIAQLNSIREEVDNSLKRKSVFDANSFYERSSANTPMIGKMRRNISNNNSVYSNKSSNRILKSEMKSREQLQNQYPTRQGQDRLDTVHQNNSEVSVRTLNEDRRNLAEFAPASREREKQPQKREGNLFIGSQHNLDESRGRTPQQNQMLEQQNGQNNEQQQKPVRNQKIYQKSTQYKEGFKTRSRLVRTPPQK